MIQIDMEMPESCAKCWFRMWYEFRSMYYCGAKRDISLNTVAEKDRHESCPLIEVKE